MTVFWINKNDIYHDTLLNKTITQMSSGLLWISRLYLPYCHLTVSNIISFLATKVRCPQVPCVLKQIQRPESIVYML